MIDAHTHFFPKEWLIDKGKWAKTQRELHWLDLMQSPIQDEPSIERFLEDMRLAQISKSILMGWYWQSAKTCEAHNAFYLDLIQQYPQKLLAFAAFSPKIRKPVAYIESLIEAGFIGIGELLPEIQGFDFQKNTNWKKVLAFAEKHQIPINFHVTELIGHDYKGRVSQKLQNFIWLAKNFPNLPVILSHWGGGLIFYEFNPHIRNLFQNFYYDTAASPRIYDMSLFKHFAEPFQNKILWGSDYPLKAFPREAYANRKNFIQAVHDQKLPKKIVEKIFCKNTQKLLLLRK